jgi:hypothetical protein
MMKVEDGDFVAYATAETNSRSRTISLTEFIMIDSLGNLVAEGSGEITIGSYRGRKSHAKVKKAVRSFTRSLLQAIGAQAELSLANISLRDAVEMEKLRARLRSARYDYVRGLV